MLFVYFEIYNNFFETLQKWSFEIHCWNVVLLTKCVKCKDIWIERHGWFFCSIYVSCNWDSINCRSDVSSCTSFLMQMFVESSSSFFCTVSSTSRRKHLSTFCTTRQVCTKGSRGNRGVSISARREIKERLLFLWRSCLSAGYHVDWWTRLSQSVDLILLVRSHKKLLINLPQKLNDLMEHN